jgi:predicted RNase H-like HicB family nuclease
MVGRERRGERQRRAGRAVRKHCPAGRDTLIVTREGEWFVARDEASGITSQGRTKSETLSNLAEALKLYAEDVDNVATEEPDAPWFSGG